MQRTRLNKLTVSVLFVFLAYLLSMRIESLAGTRLNLCLAALIALSFFLEWHEALLASAFAAFLINWSPALTPEMVFYVVFPIVIVAARRAFHWTRPLHAACAAFLTLLFMDALANYSFLAAYPSFALADALAGALMAGLVFRGMDYCTNRHE